MARLDMADHVVHFTSGDTLDAAFDTLCRIVEEGRLRGNAGFNRGGHVCVCFTEAPLLMIPDGPVNPDAYSRYKPFGVMFDKRWMFSHGGRPVIYQSDREYEELPDALKWRHMRYEPDADPAIDFTWEREWRLCVDELPLRPNECVIVLPDRAWETRLRDVFRTQQDWQVEQYAQVLDRTIAEQYREDFPWRVASLRTPDPA